MDCHLLSHGISVEKDALHDCCLLRDVENNGRPFIIKIENGTVNWEDFFSRKKLMKERKLDSYKDCKGCKALRDYCYGDDRYISYINFNHWNICNSKCMYCGSEYNGGDKIFNVYPMMKELVEKGYFRNDGEITFQGGEPTLLPEFEDLLNLFGEKGAKIRIHSSGIKYSRALEKFISKGLATVVISPDAGCKETYQKIKHIQAFDKVWEHIASYADAQKTDDRVKAKFIFIPDINDNLKEVDKWLKKVKESKVKTIIIDAEYSFASKNDYKVPYLDMLFDYVEYRANKDKLNLEWYDSASYCNLKRTSHKHKFNILFKPLLNGKIENLKRALKT